VYIGVGWPSSATGETDLEHVLELVAKRARALTEARATVVLLRDGEELVVAALAGELDRTLVGARIPIEGSVSGYVFRSGRPERLADAPSRRSRAPSRRRRRRACSFHYVCAGACSASCARSIDCNTGRGSASATNSC
jgi:GAF domain